LKVDIFIKIYSENPDLVKSGQKYRALYMKNYVCSILLTVIDGGYTENNTKEN